MKSRNKESAAWQHAAEEPLRARDSACRMCESFGLHRGDGGFDLDSMTGIANYSGTVCGRNGDYVKIAVSASVGRVGIAVTAYPAPEGPVRHVDGETVDTFIVHGMYPVTVSTALSTFSIEDRNSLIDMFSNTVKIATERAMPLFSSFDREILEAISKRIEEMR